MHVFCLNHYISFYKAGITTKKVITVVITFKIGIVMIIEIFIFHHFLNTLHKFKKNKYVDAKQTENKTNAFENLFSCLNF